MTYTTAGFVTTSVVAGHIRPTSQPMNPKIGKQIAMGEDLHINITPDIARQWIDVLQTIATTEEESAA